MTFLIHELIFMEQNMGTVFLGATFLKVLFE